MACTDILTAEYVSNLLGVATAQNISVRKQNGIDGELEYGQKNISNIQRKLLNPDEILRLQTNKMIVILRGNKPLLMDKMIYTEHILVKELKDNPVSEYIPEWQKNKQSIIKMQKENLRNKRKITFKNF